MAKTNELLEGPLVGCENNEICCRNVVVAVMLLLPQSWLWVAFGGRRVALEATCAPSGSNKTTVTNKLLFASEFELCNWQVACRAEGREHNGKWTGRWVGGEFGGQGDETLESGRRRRVSARAQSGTDRSGRSGKWSERVGALESSRGFARTTTTGTSLEDNSSCHSTWSCCCRRRRRRRRRLSSDQFSSRRWRRIALGASTCSPGRLFNLLYQVSNRIVAVVVGRRARSTCFVCPEVGCGGCGGGGERRQVKPPSREWKRITGPVGWTGRPAGLPVGRTLCSLIEPSARTRRQTTFAAGGQVQSPPSVSWPRTGSAHRRRRRHR